MKKKVLFYNGSLRMGGIERVMVEVLQNLNEENYEIDLLIEDGVKKLNIFEKDIPKNIKLYYLKSENIISKTDYYRQRKKNPLYKMMYQIMMGYEKYIKKKNIKKIVKNKKYDTVIDFDMGLSKYITLINVNKKIAWVHANIIDWYQKESRIKRLGERLKAYENIVVICEAMKENTEKLYPFLKEKLVRIYNPFNFEKIKEKAEEKIDIHLKEFYSNDFLISVMRLTLHQKDFITLIKGFKKAKKSGIKEKLYILGDGPDKERIQKIIEQEEMANEIFLLGNISNPYPWIKKAKLFLHSSKYEGLPTVLIEGLILNKVIISSDCPTGPREILEEGKIGHLYKVGDWNKLAKLIVKNLQENRIDINLINKYIEKYKVLKVIEEYNKIL